MADEVDSHRFELPADILGLIANRLPTKSLLQLSLVNKTIGKQVFHYLREFDSNNDGVVSDFRHPVSGVSLGPRSESVFFRETHAENVCLLPYLSGLHTLSFCVHNVDDMRRLAEALWRNRNTLEYVEIDISKVSKPRKRKPVTASHGDMKISFVIRVPGEENDDDDDSDNDMASLFDNDAESDGGEAEKLAQNRASRRAASGSITAKDIQQRLLEGDAVEALTLLMRQVGLSPENHICIAASRLKLKRFKRLDPHELSDILSFFSDIQDLSVDATMNEDCLKAITERCPKLRSLCIDLAESTNTDALERCTNLKTLIVGGIGSLLMTAATIPVALAGNPGIPEGASQFSLSMMRQVAIRGPPELGYNVAVRLAIEEDENVRTVLQIGVATGDTNIVEWMLRCGASPHDEHYLEQTNRSALFQAFQLYCRNDKPNSYLTVLNLLLDFGANVWAPCQPRSVSLIHHLINRGEIELLRNILFEKRRIYVLRPSSRPDRQSRRDENSMHGHQDNMFGFVTALLGVVAGAAGADQVNPSNDYYEFDEVWMTPFEYSKSIYGFPSDAPANAIPEETLSLVHAAASWLPDAPNVPVKPDILKIKLELLKWLLGESHDGDLPDVAAMFSPEMIGSTTALSHKLRMPLHSSAHADIVDFLVSRGAPINGDASLLSLLPIFCAAYYGRVDTLARFLHYGGRNEIHQALQWAIRGGRPEAILYLFNEGAELPRDNMIELEPRLKSYSSCVFLAALISAAGRLSPADSANISSVMLKIWESPVCSEEEKVAFLSEAFPIVREHGSVFEEPLNGVIVMLMNRGGAELVRKANLRRAKSGGISLLMAASFARSLARVQTVINLCPETAHEFDEEGQTALHYAACPPHSMSALDDLIADTQQIINLLVDAGVDVLAKSKIGKRATDLASEAPHDFSHLFLVAQQKAKKRLSASRRKEKESKKIREKDSRPMEEPVKKTPKKRKRADDPPNEAAPATAEHDTKSPGDQVPEPADPPLRRSKRHKRNQ